MKILLIALLMITTTSIIAQESKKIKLTVSGKIHKPSMDCKKGFGLCDFGISVTFEKNSTSNVLMDATIDGQFLIIEFKEDISLIDEYKDEDLNTLVIDEDRNYNFDEATRKAFDRNFITILAGKYSVDYSNSKYGTVKLKIK